MNCWKRFLYLSLVVTLISACSESKEPKNISEDSIEDKIEKKNHIFFEKGTHLEDIANNYGITIQSILGENDSISYEIKEGELLKISTNNKSQFTTLCSE